MARPKKPQKAQKTQKAQKAGHQKRQPPRKHQSSSPFINYLRCFQSFNAKMFMRNAVRNWLQLSPMERKAYETKNAMAPQVKFGTQIVRFEVPRGDLKRDYSIE